MLTQTDYANLAALVSRATFNGINEAMAGVALFDKLQRLASPPAPEASNGDSPNNP